jgi:hypothetical protein
MKCKIINLVKVLGCGYNEIVYDYIINDVIYNSLEFDEKTNNLYLHIFDEDIDYQYDFEFLSDEEKLELYLTLAFNYN